MTDKTESTTTTAPTATSAAPAGTAATDTLETPIIRGANQITQVHLRRPKAGALRGINLAELLQLRAEAVITLLPRITEPPLLKPEVEGMDPADLIACAQEVVDFLVPKATLEKAAQAMKDAESLSA